MVAKYPKSARPSAKGEAPAAKKKNNKGWSARRRKQQACNARRNKPWKNATGPKTPEGKAKVSRNAYKSGAYAADMEHLRQALKYNRLFLKHVRAHYNNRYFAACLAQALTKQNEEKGEKRQ